jgi:putative glutamine amidotransferase
MKIIGITGGNPPFNTDLKAPFLAARQKYIEVIVQHGALGVLIPNIREKKVIEDYAEHLDGLLLTGGGDIHPLFYKKEKNAMTGEMNQTVDTIRDEAELMYFNAFFEKKKPILGICRGSQIINVALGGTLAQHIQDIIPNLTEIHMNPQDKGFWYEKVHSVTIAQDSKLHTIIGNDSIDVNSGHHQMVEEPGKYIEIVANSPQGVHEAIEYTGERFVIGVQWHPEQIISEESSKKLFDAFIHAE